MWLAVVQLGVGGWPGPVLEARKGWEDVQRSRPADTTESVQLCRTKPIGDRHDLGNLLALQELYRSMTFTETQMAYPTSIYREEVGRRMKAGKYRYAGERMAAL